MKNNIKIGSIVKMNPVCKQGFIVNDCQEHVDEFGECIGIIEELYSEYSEAKVRWKPSNLNYIYNIDHLELINI